MKMLTRLAIFAGIITLSLTLGACREKGPAEKAGEAIDQTVEDTTEAVEDAVTPDGPVEEAGEEIDEAIDTTKEKASEAKEETEEALK
ncbi:MAG TPA: hypothetical protein VKN62_01735 [Pelovirga sp.]|nr:hypothetical protein [Pelovirga sp.]